MIKFIIFFFHVFVTHALNSDDCRQKNHPVWLCDYMHLHNKTYKTHSEMLMRKHKLQAAKEPEQEDKAYFGLTSRSDRFPHELRSNIAFVADQHKKLERMPAFFNTRKYPPIDWRNHNGRNYVTSVKDQGECGGCFAFASAAVLEYWSVRRTGFPKSLSAQSIMDCTSGRGRPDIGCDGGLMEYVFEYAKEHPIGLEQDFPFTGHLNTCPNRLVANVNVQEYTVVTHEDNKDAEFMLEYVLHHYGPVAAGIDSTRMDNYVGGVYPASRCSTDIDHAVTIVGYTPNAWIIKNSWGTGWGEDGYLYLERGKNACGIAEYMVFIRNAYSLIKNEPTYWQMEAYDD